MGVFRPGASIPAGAMTGGGRVGGTPTYGEYWNGYSGIPGMDASINQATGQSGAYSQQDRAQLEGLLNGGGQKALDQYAQGAMSSAMPGLNKQLQAQQEQNIRSGTSTGDLGSSFEGDIYSAFQRNMANALAGQSMNLYNTNVGANEGMYNTDQSNYLEQMYANRNNAQGQQNARRQRNSNLWGALGGLFGSAAGLAVPGLGAGTGAGVGSALGGALGA